MKQQYNSQLNSTRSFGHLDVNRSKEGAKRFKKLSNHNEIKVKMSCEKKYSWNKLVVHHITNCTVTLFSFNFYDGSKSVQ